MRIFIGGFEGYAQNLQKQWRFYFEFRLTPFAKLFNTNFFSGCTNPFSILKNIYLINKFISFFDNPLMVEGRIWAFYSVLQKIHSFQFKIRFSVHPTRQATNLPQHISYEFSKLSEILLINQEA
ncbi:MAG: hypothetical protein F6K25_18115 [Okeania sp. SIO2G4]|uniref:Uncharacterized protein n=2 Tax=Okeania TaxID=1458928 RepID=A0A3N6RK98_9CYAN|nr:MULTISPECIES: hypothetical protein [unclassified Okeania]NEP07343.1 hypothetical protein [Okeania sp. SIO4D6]NEP75247.1 hypothetical protein [Okeania sp. SIO2G5]NEQ92496.1 hypothetical protein [Okeania sp. SIO2G4]RQH35572.1 hypothetical protein D5R40_20060 [Okeania hirsuta]